MLLITHFETPFGPGEFRIVQYKSVGGGRDLAHFISILRGLGTPEHTFGELVYFGYGVGTSQHPNRDELDTQLLMDLGFAQNTFILYHGKKVVGHIAFGTLPDVDIPYITGFVVHRDYRRQGLGTKLLKFAIQNLKLSSFFGHTNRPEVVNLLAKLTDERGWAGVFGRFQFAQYPPDVESALVVAYKRAAGWSFPEDAVLGDGFLAKPAEFLAPAKREDLGIVAPVRTIPAFCQLLALQQEKCHGLSVVAPVVMVKVKQQ